MSDEHLAFTSLGAQHTDPTMNARTTAAQASRAPLDSDWSPRPIVLGRAIGLMFLAIFGAFWAMAGIGISGAEGLIGLALWAGTLLLTLGRLFAGIRLARSVRSLPRRTDAAARARSRRFGWQFLIGMSGMLSSGSEVFWEAGVAYAAALSLWLTAAVILRQSRQILATAQSALRE